MRRLLRTALAALLAAAIAAAAAHALADLHGAGRKPKPFSISGHVEGLTPGKRTPLALKIRNPWPWRIRVISVSAFADGSGRHCPLGNLKVRGFRGSFVVKAGATRVLMLDAGLSPSAPTGCQGATFGLTFKGRAVRR